jgi:hypothetical protein
VGAALLIRSALDEWPEAFRARIGTPSPADVAVAIPKIVDIDEDTGEVLLDDQYLRKRSDWSYAPEGVDANEEGRAVERP